MAVLEEDDVGDAAEKKARRPRRPTRVKSRKRVSVRSCCWICVRYSCKGRDRDSILLLLLFKEKEFVVFVVVP